MKYLITIIIIFSLCVISCDEPHPIYGTWGDNRGNTISFFTEENTFLAKIDSGGSAINYEGNFIILQNSLTFNCDNGYKIVTEWDLRGNILYLNWPMENNTTIMLTLYKISN